MSFNRSYHVEVCRSKKWFETEEEAKAESLNAAKFYHHDMFTYHCVFCNLYHLSSSDQNWDKHYEVLAAEVRFRFDSVHRDWVDPYPGEFVLKLMV